MSPFRGSLDRIWTVARRERKAMFDHPTGYVLLVVFVAANAFLFFRQAYVTGTASLRAMLDLLPWMFLFFVPAVSMRVIAEETRTGTIELVLTQPLTELELLAGKYLGVLTFLAIGLALTLPIPLTLGLGAHLHWGPIVAQYVGAMLLALGLSGVGVWASTIARSQITAFILAVAVTFVLVLVGLDPLLVGLPPTAGAIAARLGVLSHFDSIGRGVIDFRDAIYFLSLGGVFLGLAYAALVRRRLSAHGAAARRLTLGTAIVVVGLVVLNLAGGYISGRIDLTPGGVYTLSRATRQIVGNLDDIVTIKVFASDELPTHVALLKRDLDDLLRDLRSASHGKIRLERRNPSNDPSAKRDAQSLGIGPVQFNVIGKSELQVKEGYLGLAMQYASGTETIPLVSRTDDLEYRLASGIRALTRPKKPALGVIADAGDARAVDLLRQQLDKAYEVRSITLTDSTQPAADVAAVVLIGSTDSLPRGVVERMRGFFHRGGSALVLAGGMQLSPQMPMANPRPVGWNEILKPFGVSVKSDMVYDLASSDIVPVGTSSGVSILQRYPFFVRAQGSPKSIVSAEVSHVLVPWSSSIDTSHSASWSITPLLVTSRAAGAVTGMTTIDPTRDYPRTDLSRHLVAVQVAPAKTDTGAHGRVILVSSSQVAMPGILNRVPQNVSFVLNAVDWLAQDESLIAIRSRDTQPPTLAFETATQREGVKYANVIGVPVLTALFGFLRLARRRKKSIAYGEPRQAGVHEGALA